MYPDIWSLKEWSNWVTPDIVTSRFDTVFFLAALQHVPSISADGKEIQQIQWSTPTEYIFKNGERAIFLPPPQFYEISRLQNFSDIRNLMQFASDREICGTEQFLPYFKVCIGHNFYTILPGDALYSDKSISEIEQNYLKHIPESKIQHRIEHSADYSVRIIINNYRPLYNHVAPFTRNKL